MDQALVRDRDQRVDAFREDAAMPSSAARRRRLPSKSNGLVTTPTVSAPALLASLAITGDAPVPVPPPMPAVMKTMSVSRMISRERIGALFGRARADLGTTAGAETR